jgi:hypothetical protein
MDWISGIVEGVPLPIGARVFHCACLTKYAPVSRCGEMRLFSGGKDYCIDFYGRGGNLRAAHRSGGDIFAFKLSALIECGFPFDSVGLLATLFFVWNMPDAPLYLPEQEGGYGYLDIPQDMRDSLLHGIRWAKFKRLCKGMSNVIRTEKMRGGVWRVVFLLERCRRDLYENEDSRKYGGSVEYLLLHERYYKGQARKRLEGMKDGEESAGSDIDDIEFRGGGDKNDRTFGAANGR